MREVVRSHFLRRDSVNDMKSSELGFYATAEEPTNIVSANPKTKTLLIRRHRPVVTNPYGDKRLQLLIVDEHTSGKLAIGFGESVWIYRTRSNI